jgi:osmotically-inducible protein OsmY/sporulation protein YlmC with PRC-barrel domain
MVETRWEFKIGSIVAATDGEYGHLEQLLVDPHQERVVALLVRPHRLIPSPAVVVPEELIAAVSEQEVRLEIDREQVGALPTFWPESGLIVEDQFYEVDDELFAVRGKQGVKVGRAPNSREPGMIENQHTLSEGEHLGLRVRAGQPVFCQDGYAGRVSLILSDAKGRVKGLVLHTGHLPLIGRDLIVPTAWVLAVDKVNVHLSVSKIELERLPDYSPDDALSEKVDAALWSDDILRNTDYVEISVSVQDGIVKLRGHVISLLNKTRIENAARSVAGVLGVENDLVVDQDLVTAVARALGIDELTRFERISVGADNGVIRLNGQVRSNAVRDTAEAIAASIPQVRGVINNLKAPDGVIDLEEPQFWQPPIGQEVSAEDMLLGQVESVIIDHHNRCATGFVVHGYFPDFQKIDDDRLPGEDLQHERRVVIPIDAIRYTTDSSVSLKESGFEAALHPDFNPAAFIHPDAAWQPPYPYLWEEVLFEREKFYEPILKKLQPETGVSNKLSRNAE